MASCGHDHGGGHGHSHSHVMPTPGGAIEQSNEQQLGYAAPPPPVPSSSDADSSLSAAFTRAEAMYHHVVDGEGTCSGPHDEARHLADALSAFVACARRIRSEGAVSRNEVLADINTGAFQLASAADSEPRVPCFCFKP